MKTFEQIIKEYQKTSAQIKELEKIIDQLTDQWRNLENMQQRHDAFKACKDETITTSEKINDLKIKRAFLANNAKIALFENNIDTIVSIWNRYQGKAYGEKTSEKIKAEIKEKTNCYFWINSDFGQHNSFCLSPCEYHNSFQITGGTKYQDGKSKSFLIDNKVQPVAVDDLRLFYIRSNYIENIPAEIRKAKKLYKAAADAQKALNAACSAYMAVHVDGMPETNARQNIFDNLRM